MVTRYDVISSRWSSQFWVKIHFFQFLSTIKVNLVAKIMQSACLWVIFHVKHKKLPFLTVLTLFLILENSKMPTIVGDVTGLQQSHHPLNIPHLVKKIKGFPLNVKEFQNTAPYQKRQGGVPSTPPPPPMNLRLRPRNET